MDKLSEHFDPDYAVAPGETLREAMAERGMAQKELAARTELARKTINEILKGKAPISPETAAKLALVFAIPAEYWTNLEAKYQQRKALLERRREMAEVAGWHKKFPYTELAKRGLVLVTRDAVEKVEQLCRFFGVSSPDSFDTVVLAPIQARFKQSPKVAHKPFIIATWLQAARIASRKIEVGSYNPAAFADALSQLRSLSAEKTEPQQQIQEHLAKAGVVVVFVREFAGAAVSGAAFWESGRPVIALTRCGKRLGKFWFTLFHEAMHILHHGKSGMFVDMDQSGWDKLREESDANRWAAQLLIPHKHDKQLAALTTIQEVDAFAVSLNIHRDIVVHRVERLQKDYKKWAPYRTWLAWEN
ncbi:MAG: HigA family addiction module antitoxin [Phycisphaerae bacterium]